MWLNRDYGLDCRNCGQSLFIRNGPFCDEIVCPLCWKPLCKNCGRVWNAKRGGLRHKIRGRRCRFEGYPPHLLRISPPYNTITLDPINLIEESEQSEEVWTDNETDENMLSGYEGDNDINNETMDNVEVETDENINNSNGNGLCLNQSSMNTDIDTVLIVEPKQEINCDLDAGMSEKDEREWRYKLKDAKFARSARNKGYTNIHKWQSKRKYVKRTKKYTRKRRKQYKRYK